MVEELDGDVRINGAGVACGKDPFAVCPRRLEVPLGSSRGPCYQAALAPILWLPTTSRVVRLPTH